MSIFRRVSFLGFASVSLVVLAACGGDGDGSGEAFELPPPGEYSFEVTGTMEIEFLEEAVSAAPLALGAPQTVDYEGSLRITLGENGSFTLVDKDGLILRAEEVKEGPITFTNDADKGSSGTITEDGTKMELNVVAELPSGETATNEEPIRLEGDGNPFSDEGATLSTPPNAEAVGFVSADDVVPAASFGIQVLFIGLFGGFGLPTPTPEADDDDALPTATESQGAEFSSSYAWADAVGDEFECAGGEDAVVDDGDVDVVSVFVGVTQVRGGVEVRVELRESPPEGQEWFSSSVQVKIGQEGRIQVGQSEVHDGTPNSGRIDDAGNVIPGSEADVEHEGKFVTIFFPNLDIEEGDTLEVRAFHQMTAEDTVHCDVTDAFSLDELILVPCGGECDREE